VRISVRQYQLDCYRHRELEACRNIRPVCIPCLFDQDILAVRCEPVSILHIVLCRRDVITLLIVLTPFGGDMNREKKTSQDMCISNNISKELRYGKFVREFLSTILFVYLL
jgi:hypothetical protein